MFNKWNLTFYQPEVEQSYLKDFRKESLQIYTMYSIFSQVFLIFKVVEAVQTSSIYQITFSAMSIPLMTILLITIWKKPQYIDYVIYATQVIKIKLIQFQKILAIFIDDVQQLIDKSNKNPEECWFISSTGTIWHILIFFQGSKFIQQTLIFFISFLLNISTKQVKYYYYIQYTQLFVCIILFRYFFERKKRIDYISQKENEKWTYVIEKVLPTWVVVLKYDLKQTLLVTEKSNRYFIQEFQIKDDFQLRKMIRSLKVFTESQIRKDMRPISVNAINYEKHLIKLLTKSGNQQEEIQKFYAFIAKPGQTQRVFKLTQVFFQSTTPLVLLNLEEVTENKFNDLEKQILFRDKSLANYCQHTCQVTSKCIAFLKTFKQMTQTMMKKNQKMQQVFTPILDEQIISQYLLFNDLLNLHSLIKVNYNDYKYQMQMIKLSQLKTWMKTELKMQEEHALQKMNSRSTPFLLKRAGSQNRFPLSMVKNDKQKLTQIILTIYQFIRFMVQTEDPECDIPISFQIKQIKKFYHPLLKIPEEFEKILNRNWSNSQTNENSFGYKQHIETIKLLMETAKVYLPNDLVKPLNWCGLPLAQHLISQIGPFNLLFFKEKIGKDKLKPSPITPREEVKQFEKEFVQEEFKPKFFNQIKFMMYQDLSYVLNEINEKLPNPEFILFIQSQELKDEELFEQIQYLKNNNDVGNLKIKNQTSRSYSNKVT